MGRQRCFITAAILTLTPSMAIGTIIHVPTDQPSVQAGIYTASPGDTVMVSCGVYYEHDIEMTSGICLVSETGSSDCVTLDAQQKGRVLICGYVDDTTTICGFTVANGLTDSFSNGGGIHCCLSSPEIRNVVLTGNAAHEGGAIFCGASSPTLINVDFIGNSAVNAGGGMACGPNSAPDLTAVLFSENTASAGSGGGMHCRYGSSPALTVVTFDGNHAAHYGGGLALDDTVHPTLDGVTFKANSAEWAGGALYCYSTSPPIADCSFLDNSADLWGGAIYCLVHGDPTLSGCVLSGNAAHDGGGLSCSWSSSPVLEATTLFENSADGDGGGVYVGSSCSVVLDRVIVAFGGAGGAVACDEEASATLNCCDVYGNVGGDWVGCIASQSGLDGNISLDPLFCLDVNPAEPLALYSNSPCSADSNQQCGQIGAFGVGCEGTSVERTTWGRLKSLFR